MAKIIALVVIVFVMLFDLESVFALDMPKISGNPFGSSFSSVFPSGNFPFPSKTPKPSASATATPTAAPTATPAPTTVFEITDVEPSSANYMQEFRIFGTNFGDSAGSVSFRQSNQSFVSAGAPIVSWSNTEIVAKVPALKKGYYRIQVVRADGQKSNEERFSVKNGQPIVNSNSISAVNGKYEMTFQGTEFGSRRGGVINIYDGSTVAANGIIKYWSSSKVRFELPNLPRKQYGFQIQTADGRQSSLQFFTVGN